MSYLTTKAGKSLSFTPAGKRRWVDDGHYEAYRGFEIQIYLCVDGQWKYRLGPIRDYRPNEHCHGKSGYRSARLALKAAKAEVDKRTILNDHDNANRGGVGCVRTPQLSARRRR